MTGAARKVRVQGVQGVHPRFFVGEHSRGVGMTTHAHDSVLSAHNKCWWLVAILCILVPTLAVYMRACNGLIWVLSVGCCRSVCH